MAKYRFFSPFQVWKGILLSVTVLKSRLYRERTLHIPFSQSVSFFLPPLSAGQKNSKHLFKVESMRLFHGPWLGLLWLKNSNAALIHIFTGQLKG